MATPVGLRNVGAVAPDLRTSPVLEEMAEASYEPRHQIPETDLCYFNGEIFASGELVRSGTMVLECRDGVWIEIGPADPDNP